MPFKFTNSDMKKFWLAVCFVFIAFLGWYLFLKSYDVQANFQVNAYPGTVVQIIKTWSSSLPEAEITFQDSIYSIGQKITIENDTYFYDWVVEQSDKGSSEITVLIQKDGHSLAERLALPFVETKLESSAKGLIKELRNTINSHLDITNVRIEGVVDFDSVFCVYLPVKATQYGKAYGMMRYYSALSFFVSDNDLMPNGVPIVEITSWKMSTDNLAFDFCYPIQFQTELPLDSIFRYKWIPKQKAIKAIYNGNYITSDRAWFELLNYAHQKGMKVSPKPIEVFYDNPNFGNNEKNWKAEIFLPLNSTE